MSIETPEALKMIGSLAVRFKLISEEQLQLALDQHDEQSPPENVGQTFLDMGMLSPTQLNFLHDAQQMKVMRIRDIKFGKIAVKSGFVSEPQVEGALQQQKEHFVRHKRKSMIGDILIEEGAMSEEQRQSVVETQKRLARELRESQAQARGEKLLGKLDAVKISLARDGLSAILYVDPDAEMDGLREQIDAMLQEYGVVHGLVSEIQLDAWLHQGAEREEKFVIARGTAPVQGHGGEITYHFDTNPLKVGEEHDGIIDFKERGQIPQVKEGDLLAELSDPDPGTPGTNIYGKEIPVKSVKPVKFKIGKGVKLAADGKSVTADLDGSPSLAMNKIAVYPQRQIDGDIGYETGHVEFDGDIQVKGAVERDFRVRGGRLTANEIEAADIDIKGDVVVQGGIHGARMKVGGNLIAAFIHNAEVEVAGNVEVKKEIMGCDIMCGGSLFAEKGRILRSRIATRQGITVRDVGSDNAAASTLMVGSDALLEAQIAELREESEQRNEQITALRVQMDDERVESGTIDMEIAEIAQVQDSSQVELRQLKEQREALVDQGMEDFIDDVDQQIAEVSERAAEAERKVNAMFERQDAIAASLPELEQQIATLEEENQQAAEEIEALEQQMEEEQGDAFVKVSGTMHPLTTIVTAHTKVKTKHEMKKLTIREAVRHNEAGDEFWKITTEKL